MVGLGGQESAALARRGAGGTQHILDDIYVVVSNLKRE
jgi:molybdopterin/thiamine biosynthesis adenylyltransferase